MDLHFKAMPRWILLFFAVSLCLSCTRFDDPVVGVSSKIEIKMNKAAIISSDTILFEGIIEKEGNEPLLEVGFVYDVKTSPNLNNNKIKAELKKGLFSEKATELSPNKQYYVAAYGLNKLGAVYSEELNFNTPKRTPRITLTNVKSYSPVNALISCNIGNDGGSPITEKGVCWSLNAGAKISDNKLSSTSISNEFETLIPNLKPGTTYYIRTYAINELGIAYGPEIIVKTLEYKLAVIDPTCGNASAVGYDFATVNSIIINSGLSENLESGVILGDEANTQNLTYNNPKTQTIKSSLSTIGQFSITINNLNAGTTYNYVTYVKNEAGVSYGSICSFKTNDYEAPTIDNTCIPANNIGLDIATINGNVLNDGGTSTIEKGFIFGVTSTNLTYQNPETQTLISSEKTKGSYNFVIKSLQPNTTYYYKSFCKNVKGVVYGAVCEFKTNDYELPIIEQNCIPASDIGYNIATISGNVISDGGTKSLEKGFIFSTSTNNLTYLDPGSQTLISSENLKGPYNYVITSLKPNSIYYYRTYSKNLKGIVYGPNCEFQTTNYAKPKLNETCLEVTELTATSAKIFGEIIDDGGDPNLEKGFVYSESFNISPSTDNKLVSSSLGKGVFSFYLTNLLPSKTYYYMTYAKNSLGDIVSGKTCTFSTPSFATPNFNKDCLPVSDISLSTAKISAELIDDGGDLNIEKGFVYGKTRTLSDLLYSKNSSNTLVSSVKGKGAFSYLLTKLSAGTTYYYWPYALNSQQKIEYGQICSFTTIAANKPTISTNCITPTDISYTTASIYGYLESWEGDDYGDARELGAIWSTSYSTINTSNPIGSISSKIYNWSGSGLGLYKISMDNLNPGVTYYYRMYAENSAGVTYGPVCTLTTNNYLKPTFSQTCTDPTDITNTSAMLYAKLLSDGGDSGEAGFLVSESPIYEDQPFEGFKFISNLSSGILKKNAIGLNSRTRYWYRAYMKNNAGTGYGPQLCYFSTLPTIDPPVITGYITNLSPTSATLNGSVKASDNTYINKGFIWSSTPDFSNSNMYNFTDKSVSDFSYTLNKEAYMTKIYYKAFITYSTGTIYGDAITFKFPTQ